MNRRFVSLLLAALMLLMLAACKTEEAPAVTTAETAAPAESVPGVTETPEEFRDEIQSVLDGTQTGETEAAEESTDAAETEATEETTSATEETTAQPTVPAATMTEYEWYNALSGEEQMAYMETFDSMAAFFDWYNAAKAEYEKQNPSIEIGDGNINLDDLLGDNG